MGTFPRVNQIRRAGALTLLGNSQAVEGRAEDLTASEARIILGLATTSDVTFDIVRATTSVQTPLVNNASAALTLGNSTYGVTVPGAATVGGASGSFGKLHVKQSASAYTSGVAIEAPSNDSFLSLRYDTSDTFIIEPTYQTTGAYKALTLRAAEAGGVFIKTTGDVGIGASSVIGRLGVKQATSVYSSGFAVTCVANDSALAMWHNGSKFIIEPTYTLTGSFQDLAFRTSDTERLVISAAGAATFSGDISMQKTTQGYIRSHGPGAVGRYTEMYHDDTRGYVKSNFGGLVLNPAGIVYVGELSAVSAGGQMRVGYSTDTWTVFNGHINYNAGVRIFAKTTTSQGLGVSGLPGQTSAIFSCDDSGGNQLFSVEPGGGARSWGAYNTKYTQTIHDGTNGIISTSAGNLNLVPAGGTVAVTGAGTFSSTVDAVRYGISGWSFRPSPTASGSAAIYDDVNSRETMRLNPQGNAYFLNNVYLNAAISGEAGIILQQSGVTKWQMYDVSSSFRIYNFTTAANAMTIAAATSDATFAGGITASGNVTLTGSTATVAASTSLLRLTSAATGFEFRPAAGYIEQWTSGSDSQYNIYDTTGTKRLQLKFLTASGGVPDAGYIVAPKLIVDVGNTAGVMCLGGGASNDPGIKRGGINTLSARRFDDSADAAFTCAGITASGNVSYAQGLSTGTVTKSANYTTTADDYCVNVTANSIDITFETAVGCANREHEVINSGSGVVTLKTTSAQTISGSASGALTLAQWKSIRVKSDGANWLIMSQVT